jgi:hypothetical protein
MHDRASLVDGRVDVAAFCLLAALGAAVYWPIFGIRALNGDNLYILWWVHTAPASALLRLDPQIYPEWRPLPFQLIWLEHRLVPLGAVAVHHAINLWIWVTCAWLAYRIVLLLSSSRLAGFLAAAWLLSDQRSVQTLLLIVERQTSLAGCFGLLAVFLVVRAADRRLTTSESAAVALLLLASPLSKEYGLSFPLACLAYAGWRSRRDLAWPAAIAAVLYATLRLAFAGAAVGRYCDDMGFFFRSASQCIDPASPGSLAQMAYNVAASAISIPLQGLFDHQGMIGIARARIATTAVFLTLAVAGLSKGPRELRLVVLVVLFNAALGFLVYRDRNLVLGTSAMAILAGAGLARWPVGRTARVAALILLIVVVGRQAYETRKLVVQDASELSAEDPCGSEIIARPGGLQFATLVKTTYGLGNPTCLKTE